MLVFFTIVFVEGHVPLKIFALSLGWFFMVFSLWKERGKHKTNLSLKVVSFVVLLASLNILAKRFDMTYDLTEAKLFSLYPQTIEMVNKMAEPVEVLGFFKSYTTSGKRFEHFMKRVQAINPQKISWKFVDPDQDLGVTRQYDIHEYDRVILQRGEQWILLDQFNEEEFANGLTRLLRRGEKSICWSTGQMEADLEEQGAEGVSRLKDSLKKLGYQSQTLFLPSLHEVPQSCIFVALIGPKKEFSESSLALIKKFVEGGGRVLLLVDPLTQTKLQALLSQWGIDLPEALIADEYSKFGEGESTVPLTDNYVQHPITHGLGTYTFFPMARPLMIRSDHPQDFQYEPLVLSSRQSWADTNLEQFPPLYEEKKDLRGPHILALLVTLPSQNDDKISGKILVVGDSDFVRNGNLEKAANKDLILNASKWLSRDEDLIAFEPRKRTDTRLNLTATEMQAGKFICFYGLPGIIFLLCFLIWWRRAR